ncbi:MAG: UbiA family prenyltransferase, partial [Bordetella sp.]
MTTLSAPSQPSSLLRQYYVLTKPRVNALILFCAVIGMLLAQPELPTLSLVLFATLGIGLVAGAAAAVNCLVESHIDAKMARTAWRPLPSGTLTVTQVFLFSGLLGGLGLFILFTWVNALTAWLTLATFVGYAIVYTMLLKPLTPQNIVIGGASGAMPPVLGWAAVANQAPPEAWVLFLIIFVWT